jgi:hypothetical protein
VDSQSDVLEKVDSWFWDENTFPWRPTPRQDSGALEHMWHDMEHFRTLKGLAFSWVDLYRFTEYEAVSKDRYFMVPGD